MERKVCALTFISLGTAERQVVVVVPSSPNGQDGPWELKEVAYIRGDIFDALVADLGYIGGRIPGIEPIGNGLRSAVRARNFNIQTFVATKPRQEVQRLVASLPFLAPYVQDARRCMLGGDEQRNLLRGAGSTQALRPLAASAANFGA